MPRSLRAIAAADPINRSSDNNSAGKVSAVAGLIAVASFSSAAEAQQSSLPPVTIDAPVARPRPAARPTAEQVRARTALRRAARRRQPAQVAPVPFPNAGNLEADRNPYADAAAPYKIDRLSSNKFSEPILNTPKTVTVLSKELLEDKNATTLKEVGRSTAGVTLGIGRGRQRVRRPFLHPRLRRAQRHFRRWHSRSRRSASARISSPSRSRSCAGPHPRYRGPRHRRRRHQHRDQAGGRPRISTTPTSDIRYRRHASRITFDVNQVINPTLSIRAGGLVQGAKRRGQGLHHRRSLRRVRRGEVDADR